MPRFIGKNTYFKGVPPPSPKAKKKCEHLNWVDYYIPHTFEKKIRCADCNEFIEPRCRHDHCFETTITETVISEVRPIKNSRVEAINDFTIKKTKDIDKKAYECVTCGAIFKEKPKKINYAGDFSPNYTDRSVVDKVWDKIIPNNTAYCTTSVGSGSIGIGINSGFPSGFVNTDKDINNLNKNNMDMDEWFFDETNGNGQREIQRMKEILQTQKQELKHVASNHKSQTKSAMIDAKKVLAQARLDLEEAKRSIDGLKGGRSYGKNRSYSQSPQFSEPRSIPPAPKKPLKPLTVYDYVHTIFRYSNVKPIEVDDKKYYDIVFFEPMKMSDDKLAMFEGGEVLEWEKVSKGLFKGTERRIKTMRIETKILDEWYKNKMKKDED